MRKKQLYTEPDCEQMSVMLERTILSEVDSTALPPIPDDTDDDDWDDVI